MSQAPSLESLLKPFVQLIVREGGSYTCVARKTDELESLARDLKVRGALSVRTIAGDFLDLSFQRHVISSLGERPLDLAFLAWGVLGDDQRAQVQPEECAQ